MNQLVFRDIGYGMFNCKESKWQISEERGIYICHGPSDYDAQWFYESDQKWRLYIRGYEATWEDEKTLLTTVDTLYDVMKYMLENKSHPVVE